MILFVLLVIHSAYSCHLSNLTLSLLQYQKKLFTKVYFDKNSKAGHPSADKWIPLEIKEGRKTDQPHNCTKKKNGNGHTLEAAAKPDTLKFAESLLDILQDYIRLKTKEQL